MGRIALLDVNVLVALFDPDHLHHEMADDWFVEQRSLGWATCPLTENGVARVMSNPASGLERMRVDTAASRLRKFRASGHHTFWSDAVSVSDETVFKGQMAIDK